MVKKAFSFTELETQFSQQTSADEVWELTRTAIRAAGVKYVSIWQLQGKRLAWSPAAMELPDWLTNSILQLSVQVNHGQALRVSVSLDADNIYSQAYLNNTMLTVNHPADIVNPLIIGEYNFAELPLPIRRSSFQLVRQLNISTHTVFPVSGHGLVFIANPANYDFNIDHTAIENILSLTRKLWMILFDLIGLEISHQNYQT